MLRLLLLLAFCSLLVSSASAQPQRKPEGEPLLNWSLWQQYRTTIKHPAAAIKPDDLRRARANIEQYAWAKGYRDGVENGAKSWPGKLTPEFLAQMIPATTPGDTLFTPCPACRDQGKPYDPHGRYRWSASDPEHLTCQVCNTVFPNDKYPESIVLHAKYGGGQDITYCSAPPFSIFGFTGRPSFSANIRARKVGFMAGICERLAEAYALTGKPEYAEGTRAILLRLAQVYPTWLVHVGYGEYADMDPHIAALNISSLPEDELTPPPNKPDHRLHTGYWSAGRSSGVGMEAGFVRQIVQAYEFTRDATSDGKPVYSAEEQLKIERDLILESTVLLVADKSVNNKSVGNATAVSLVGMALGHPEMVHFGRDVFMKTVDGWFLPDGGTSESWSYALMTLEGINALGQACRGYTDPPGYTDKAGQRLDNLDLYHDTSYKKVWAAMFNGLKGDLNYPPLADGHPTDGIGAFNAELMADNYPENTQYLALLKALAGQDLGHGSQGEALYYREPGLEKKPAPALALPDIAFPALQIGYVRSGATGRDSALVLSASDWGVHHHLDSLSLYYWKNGKELLSDLGYLWDHPMKPMTTRTLAHNTVLVDGGEQITTGRGGRFTLFKTIGNVKVMEAESKAYPQASVYRRTVVQVEREPGRQYVVDIFRVAGGAKHEWVMHGINNDLEVVGPKLAPLALTEPPVRCCIRFQIDTPGAEIRLRNLKILGPDGKDLVVNPSGKTPDPKTGKPTGWGFYGGDGTAEWGQAKDDQPGVYLKALKASAQGMNVALIGGEANGYTGPNAFVAQRGETHKVSFEITGSAPKVNLNVLYWPTNPASAADRHYVDLTGMGTVTPSGKWTRYEGRFTITGGLDLANVRASADPGAWKLTWKIADQTRFATHWTDAPGIMCLIGDGWGQRDYRNTDLGATLPYIVRRHAADKLPTVYATAYESYDGDAAIVRSITQLPVPVGEEANTVAVCVTTDRGRDYVISCLQPHPVTIATLDGKIEVKDGFAVVEVAPH
jgi:hypothetical protein